MAAINHKKSKSISVSHILITKINILIQDGEFATVSDVINTAVAEFLGKISIIRSIDNLDLVTIFNFFEESINYVENDLSDKESFSISFSNYINKELETLSIALDKNKSYIVRVAIYDFLFKFNDNHNSQRIQLPLYDFPKSKEELEDFIIKTFEKMVKNDN